MMRITEAIKHILIVNVLFFVANLVYGEQLYGYLALWFPENPNFSYWQLITYMFMHGGFMHIVLNMYALWAFGSSLEMFWGRNKFLFFYFSAGIGSAIIHIAVNYFQFEGVINTLVNSGIPRENILSTLSEGKYNMGWETIVPAKDIRSFLSAFMTPAVGASGAVYGLLVAFAMMYPNAELFLFLIPIPIKAKYFIPILIGIDLFSGLSGEGLLGSNIAHFAHIGGALFGFIMMYYWKKKDQNKNRWDL